MENFEYLAETASDYALELQYGVLNEGVSLKDAYKKLVSMIRKIFDKLRDWIRLTIRKIKTYIATFKTERALVKNDTTVSYEVLNGIPASEYTFMTKIISLLTKSPKNISILEYYKEYKDNVLNKNKTFKLKSGQAVDLNIIKRNMDRVDAELDRTREKLDQLQKCVEDFDETDVERTNSFNEAIRVMTEYRTYLMKVFSDMMVFISTKVTPVEE